jgi:lactate racemase
LATVTLAYGTTSLDVPAALGDAPVLEAPGLAAASDPDQLWRDAASDAAARVAALPGLVGQGAAAGHLALIVPDRTRPLALPHLLPPLLEALRERGIGPGRVTIVPASGIHRPMSIEDLAAWVGDGAARSGALLAPHDADGPAVLLGETASGITVLGHPAVAGAGAVLLLGRIVFHYLAGFGGGRKMLVPGVSARPTILGVHSRCLAALPASGRHPRAITGCLDGNPVHEAACEAARLYPPAVAIHVQLAAGGVLARADAGDAFADHERAAALYAGAYRVTVGEPLDAVVVSAGGHPTDRDLVQAHKALDAVAPVVKDGGTVVFVAACGDGIGNREVERGLGFGEAGAIEEALRREFHVGVHTALALRAKTTRLRVLALTGLPDEALALAGMERTASLEDAARTIALRHGPRARVALAPRGGSLLYTTGPPQELRL